MKSEVTDIQHNPDVTCDGTCDIATRDTSGNVWHFFRFHANIAVTESVTTLIVEYEQVYPIKLETEIVHNWFGSEN